MPPGSLAEEAAQGRQQARVEGESGPSALGPEGLLTPPSGRGSSRMPGRIPPGDGSRPDVRTTKSCRRPSLHGAQVDQPRLAERATRERRGRLEVAGPDGLRAGCVTLLDEVDQ